MNARLAYSTNSATDTQDDLREVSRTAAVRRPVVAKHQPRTTDGLRHPVTVRRVAALTEAEKAV